MEHSSSVKNYSQNGIIKIIEACRANGVSELNLGDLRISFGDQTKVHSETPTVIQTKETEESEATEIRDELEKQVIETNEELLDFMNIENPQRFEQLMIEGKLEDAGSQEQEY